MNDAGEPAAEDAGIRLQVDRGTAEARYVHRRADRQREQEETDGAEERQRRSRAGRCRRLAVAHEHGEEDDRGAPCGGHHPQQRGAASAVAREAKTHHGGILPR